MNLNEKFVKARSEYERMQYGPSRISQASFTHPTLRKQPVFSSLTMTGSYSQGGYPPAHYGALPADPYTMAQGEPQAYSHGVPSAYPGYVPSAYPPEGAPSVPAHSTPAGHYPQGNYFTPPPEYPPAGAPTYPGAGYPPHP